MFEVCFHLYLIGCAISDNAHNIIEIGELLNLLLVFVDDGNIITLFAELIDQSTANLAGTDDNDLHTRLIMPGCIREHVMCSN